MRSRTGVATAALVLLCVVTAGVALAQGGYTLDSPDATSVPERSVDVDGQTYTVDSRITADPGATITVDVTAPDESYRLHVYNSDEQIEANSRGSAGGESHTFDLSGYEPGTYVVGAYSNEGRYVAVMPLIVRGYEVDVTAPDSVSQGESFDVDVTATRTAANEDPAGVRVILANSDTNITVSASGGDGSYTATVDASDLAPGEYTVYGAVQGSDQAFDTNELLGVDEGGTVTVEESDDETTDTGGSGSAGGSGGSGGSGGAGTSGGSGSSGGSGGSGGSGSGGSGGGGGAPAEDTETDTETDATETESATETDTDDGNATETDTDDGNATETDTETDDEQPAEGASPTETDGDSESPDESGAITPNDSSTDDGETTGADGPGFGPLATGLAFAAVASGLFARARRRQG